MKSIFLLLLAISLALPLTAKEKTRKSATIAKSDSLQFQLHIQDWISAYNSNDTAKLAQLYTSDAEYISSHVQGLIAHGRDNVLANFRKGVVMGGHINTIEILSINSSCDLTTILCKYKATNSGRKAIGRNLLVLKRIHGKWLIAVHMTVV